MEYLIRYKTKKGVIPSHIPLLQSFTDNLNSKRTSWKYTKHALSQIEKRFNKRTIIDYIDNTKKDIKYIYEYCTYHNTIEKVCYAMPFNSNILGIVALRNRIIITAYIIENTNWLNSVYIAWRKVLI